MKKTYNVGIREIHVRWFEVQAETEEEARSFVKERASDATDLQHLEYSHELDSDTWFVEEIHKQTQSS